MELRCSQFIIRDYRAGDEAAIARQANNRKVWRNLRDLIPHPYTEEHARQWIQLASTADPMTHFAIAVNDEVGGPSASRSKTTCSVNRRRSATGSARRIGAAASPPRPCAP